MRHKIDFKGFAAVARCTQKRDDAPGGSPLYCDARDHATVVVDCPDCIAKRKPDEP